MGWEWGVGKGRERKRTERGERDRREENGRRGIKFVYFFSLTKDQC